MNSSLKADKLPDPPILSAVLRHFATVPQMCLGKRGSCSLVNKFIVIPDFGVGVLSNYRTPIFLLALKT